MNSFDDPRCLLVSNSDDLLDGYCLCHIVGSLTCSPEELNQLLSLVSEQDYMQNFELALNVLKASNLPVPSAIESMKPYDLISNSVNLFMIFETLR